MTLNLSTEMTETLTQACNESLERCRVGLEYEKYMVVMSLDNPGKAPKRVARLEARIEQLQSALQMLKETR